MLGATMWRALVGLVTAALVTVAAPAEVALSASDKYVGFGATLLELVLVTRHVNPETRVFEYQGPLPFETELQVERVKIDFARKLRANFRTRYPELATDAVEEEVMRLPYYISADVARVLRSEGFQVPLSSLANDADAADLAARFESGKRLLAAREINVAQRGRELFSFPVKCDDNGECETDWVCFTVAMAIDGMDIESTCDLLEKIQGVSSGTWTVDDWLREIPAFIDAVKGIKSVAGLLSVENCGMAATEFAPYGKYGSEAVFYYPKAMCTNVQVVRGCFYELGSILSLVLVDAVRGMLPEDVVDVVDEIRGLLTELFSDLPDICVSMYRIGLVGAEHALKFLDSWESLFELVDTGKGEPKKPKMQLLLDMLSKLTSYTFLKNYLPTVPKGCGSALGPASVELYGVLFLSSTPADKIPSALCSALAPSAVQDCLLGLTHNLDAVDWIADALGNGNLHILAEDVIPSLCGAITDLDGLSLDDVFVQLPVLLRAYAALDLDVLADVLPGVHDTLVACSDDFVDTIEAAHKAISDGSPGPMLRYICSDRVSNNACLVRLSNGLDGLAFAAEALGTGTLKTVVQESVPEACAISKRVLDFESDDPLATLSIGSLLLHLPDLVEWYRTVASLEPLRKLVPQWPADECPADVVQELSTNLKRGLDHLDELPQQFCTLAADGPAGCLVALGASMDRSELVRPLFEESIAKAGAERTMAAVVRDMLPKVCEAVGRTGIDPEDIVRAIPIILEAYRGLDVKILKEIFPDVNAFLVDPVCSANLGDLAEWSADIIAGKESDILGGICSRVAANECLVTLSRAVDKIAFIREQIGAGTLELVVASILPQLCTSILDAAGKFTVKNLIRDLPDLLLLVDKLAMRSSELRRRAEHLESPNLQLYPLQAYVPRIPQSEHCRNAFQAIAQEFLNFMEDVKYEFSMLVSEICVAWPRKNYVPCLVQLGESFDQVELFRNLLGGKEVIQSVFTVVLPSACELISPESSLVDWNSTGFIASLPIIVDWYASLQPSMPDFLLEFLPAFPRDACNDDVLKLFQEHMAYATEGEGVQVSRILKVVCVLVSEPEKECLGAIADSVDTAPALLSAIGMEQGAMRRLIFVDVERACSILGDELDNILYSNIIAKIPEVLRFSTSLRANLPAFLAQYLPVIPHEECDAHYESISVKFSDGLRKGGEGQLPAVLCALEPEESECISLLGDALDRIELIRDLIGSPGLVRFAMETVRDLACKLLDNLSALEIDRLAEQIPEALHVLVTLKRNYTLFDAYLPAVPVSCDARIEAISANLAGVLREAADEPLETRVPRALCAVGDDGKTCLADFALSLEQVQWITDMVPDTHSIMLDLLKLLPVVCALLFGESGESELTNPDTLLEYLPTVLSLFNGLRQAKFVADYVPPISDSCMSEFDLLAANLAANGLAGVPTVLCAMPEATKQCFKQAEAEMVKMDAYKGLLPDKLVSGLIDALPAACALFTSLGSFEYHDILGSVDELFTLLNELNALPVVRNYVPNMSEHCQGVFVNSLVPRFQQEEALTGIPRAVCGMTKPEEHCIKELVRELMAIPIVAGVAADQLQISDGLETASVVTSLVDELFLALPSACDVVLSLMQSTSALTVVDNIFLVLPHVLDLLDELANFEILSKYVPRIELKCSNEFRALVAPDSPLLQVTEVAMLPRAVCDSIPSDSGLPQCFIDLAAEVDGLAFMSSSLELESMAKVLVAVLPHACEIIRKVIQPPHGDIDVEAIFDVVPGLAGVYTDLQKSIPPALKEYAPAFPQAACPDATLESIASKAKRAVLGSEDLDIPGLLCTELSTADKGCIAAIGDSLDQVAMIRDMLGRPGILSDLVGEPLSAVCTILGSPPEGGAVDATNLLAHVDLILHVVDLTHKLAPDVVAPYLPEVPGGRCKSEGFPQLSLQLANFSMYTLCRVGDLELECLAKLGDNIEETPALAQLIYGSEAKALVAQGREGHKSLLRLLVEAIPTTVCEAFDKVGQLSVDNLVAQLPEVFRLLHRLWDYPMLRAFVPQVPEVCHDGIEELVQRLLDPEQGATAAVCSTPSATKKCALDLARNVEATTWGPQYVPNGVGLVEASFEALPAVCEVLSNADFSPEHLLQYLPSAIELFFEVDKLALHNKLYPTDLGDTCRTHLRSLTASIAKLDSIGLIPEAMCAASAQQLECVSVVGDNIEQLPLVQDMIGAGTFRTLVDVFRKHACPILSQAGAIDFGAVVRAIPDLMNLLGKLESVTFLEPYLPRISSECQAMIAGPITGKVLVGLERYEAQGLLHIGHSLDFSGTTFILCNYTAAEAGCLQHAVEAVIHVEVLHDIVSEQLPLQPSGARYELDELTASTFEIRESACSMMDRLGHLNFENVFVIGRDMIEIAHKLNGFPVVHQWVPDFSDECVEAVVTVTGYVTGASPVEDLCGMSASEKRCFVEIARQLDGITEVQYVYALTSGTMGEGEYATIESFVSAIVYDVLEDACVIVQDLGGSVDGIKLAHMVGKLPFFLDSMERLGEIPFFARFAPHTSDNCSRELREIAGIAEKANTEAKGVILLCSSTTAQRECFVELNDALEVVPAIGERIPDGLVRAFVDSLDSGCKIALNQVADREEFIKKDLPTLIVNAGTIAGVNSSCLGELTGHSVSLCAVDRSCLRHYVRGIANLPLVGQLVPLWATDLLIDLCTVASGNSTLAAFLEKNLDVIVREVARLEGVDPRCAAELDRLAETTLHAEDSAGPICHALFNVPDTSGEDSSGTAARVDCVGQFVDSIERIPLAKTYLPEGLDELIRHSCRFINGGDDTIFSLLPYLAPLVQVMGTLMGYPSDTCGSQVHDASALMIARGGGFDSTLFCSTVDADCTKEVVFSLRRMPFVGHDLPEGTDELVAVSCAMINDRASYAALVEHIPTLFHVIGRIVLSPQMHIDEACQRRVRRTVLTRGGGFNPRGLCSLEESCTHELVDGLQALPLVGDHVPDSMVQLLYELCDVANRTAASGHVVYSDDPGLSSGLATVLPQVLALLGRIIGDKGVSNRMLAVDPSAPETHNCGQKLEAYGSSHAAIRAGEFCAAISAYCLVLVEEKLQRIPLVRDFVPHRAGELLATACDVIAAEGDARQIVLERMPSLLALSADILDLDAECKAGVAEVAVVFKSRRGALDGKDLCAAVPGDGCLKHIAERLQALPFFGTSIPDQVDALVRDTCALVDDSLALGAYLAKEGPQLLGLGGLMAGVSQDCDNALGHVSNVTSTAALCSEAGPGCLSELARGLGSLPLVGSYIPDGLADLFEGVCAFAEERQPWVRFARETLPKIVYLVGKAASGSDRCAYQLELFGAKSLAAQQIHVEALCRLEGECLDKLVSGLSTLPLWGPFVPEESTHVVREVCAIQADVHHKAHLLPAGEQIRYVLERHLPAIADLAINLAKPSQACRSALAFAAGGMQGQVDRGEPVDVVQAVCVGLNDECALEFVAGYRALPLVGQLVPAQTDLLFNLSCQVFSETTTEARVKAVFRDGGVLDQVALHLPTLAALAGVGAGCDKRVQEASTSELAGTGGSWPQIFACGVGEACMLELVDGLLDLPLLEQLAGVGGSEAGSSGLSPLAATMRSIVAEQPCSSDDEGGEGSGSDLNTGSDAGTRDEQLFGRGAVIAAGLVGGALLLGLCVLVCCRRWKAGRPLGVYTKRTKGGDRLDETVSRSIIPHTDGLDDLYGGAHGGDSEDDDDSGDDDNARGGRSIGGGQVEMRNAKSVAPDLGADQHGPTKRKGKRKGKGRGAGSPKTGNDDLAPLAPM